MPQHPLYLTQWHNFLLGLSHVKRALIGVPGVDCLRQCAILCMQMGSTVALQFL